MAKVVITIEDKENDRVKVEIDPSMETLFKKINSGEMTTSAEGYGVSMMRHVLEKSNDMERNNKDMKIWVPKVKGSSI